MKFVSSAVWSLAWVGLVLSAFAVLSVSAFANGGVVEPEGYRLGDYRSPVPGTLRGARVVDAGEAGDLWAEGKSDVLFIDVYPKPPKPAGLPEGSIWREPKHTSIKGAFWLGNVGFGVLAPKYDVYFRTQLEKLTSGDKSRRLVFFCLRDCWMSWNAGKRALSYGYTNVIWFPDGTDGWQDFGLPTDVIKVQE